MFVETAVALALIFGALVVFHELGHFAVAKLVGIRVEEFALGFGPKLVRLFKRGDTEYTLHPVPLGGFVKLAGMEPGEEDVADGFQAQPIWKRAVVIFSGPLASFALAVVVFVCLGIYWGFPNPEEPENRVGSVQPQTEAARIGLRAGDTVITIDGVRIVRGRQMTDLIHKKPGQEVKLLIERHGRRMSIAGTPKWTVQYLGVNWSFMRGEKGIAQEILDPAQAGKLGIEQNDQLEAVNGEQIRGGRDFVHAISAAGGRRVEIDLTRNGRSVSVLAEPGVEWVDVAGMRWSFPEGFVTSAAGGAEPSRSGRASGIELGDKLERIAGKKVTTGEQMVAALRGANGRPLAITLDRDGESKTVTVSVPASGIGYGYHDAIGLLGFLPEPGFEKMSFSRSIAKGVTDTLAKAVYLIKTLTSKRITEDVGGPLMIGKMTAASVALGTYWVVNMLGTLSLSLTFVNLLPIPVLDGGHLAILALEAVRRKRLTIQQMQAVQAVGLAIIGMIIVLVMFSDISRIAGKMVPQ